MDVPAPTSNSLLSSNKTSDSQLQVQLHPLVILIISDYVTRHTLRRQTGPIVGAIIGAHNGREVTMEHAFECKLEVNKNGEVVIDTAWFVDRLQQYKDVHKSPALDLVAWFALAPKSGPQPHHVPIHQQISEQYNESALLLAFHPDSVADGESKGSKLPITIFESVYEASTGDGDKHMQSSDEAGPRLALRFKELPYTIETGEAEMIGVDFVARGGTTATVANGTSAHTTKSDTKGKWKGKAKGETASVQDNAEPHLDILSPEDEELITSLTAKANAIRMLQQRISLIKAYLSSIPSCYLNTPPTSTEPVEMSPHAQISHPILRTISATLARLPLLTPSADETSPSQTTTITADPSTFTHQAAQQRSDVALVSLLSNLGSTIRSAQDMGKKASVVERVRLSVAANQLEPLPFQQGSRYEKRERGHAASSMMGDRLGTMSDFSSTPGDEGYVDDYDDDEDESAYSPRGHGGGGVSLPRHGKRHSIDDEEMT